MQYIDSSPVLRTVGKVAGRALIVVGIAWDAYCINEAYQEEGEFGDKTQQATGAAVGGLFFISLSCFVFLTIFPVHHVVWIVRVLFQVTVVYVHYLGHGGYFPCPVAAVSTSKMIVISRSVFVEIVPFADVFFKFFFGCFIIGDFRQLI